jgi:hypothetical protein
VIGAGRAAGSPDASGRSADVVVGGFVFSIHQIHAFIGRKRRLTDAKSAQIRKGNPKYNFNRAA